MRRDFDDIADNVRRDDDDIHASGDDIPGATGSMGGGKSRHGGGATRQRPSRAARQTGVDGNVRATIDAMGGSNGGNSGAGDVVAGAKITLAPAPQKGDCSQRICVLFPTKPRQWR